MNLVIEDSNSAIVQSNFYHSLAVAFLIVAIALLVAAITFWFVFRIPNSIRVLSRGKITNNMEYKKIPVEEGSKAVLSWNTSDMLTKDIDSEETILLSEETVLLEENQLGFKMEEDIMLIGSDESI